MRSRFDIIAAHSRKCERCEHLFTASVEDQIQRVYKCVECRAKSEQKMEPMGRGGGRNSGGSRFAKASHR